MSIETSILTEARRIGFVTAGIASVGPAESIEVFRKWLEAGNAAGMEFLKRNINQRADIRNIMPEVKSVIVVAARYPVNPEPGIGFASYCRGKDYHNAIRDKLALLAEFIRKELASTGRICVDSAPVIEREWAIRAGIGWQGKQGQIVNPQWGCCLLIGELLVNVDLKPSERLSNQCGICRKCVDACPTRAIAGEGLIDCRKCLAYLTIEHKGEIPADIHAAMGQTLFGCDRCTAVCPWNKPGTGSVMPDFLWQEMPDVKEILAMSEDQFQTRFKESSVLRTGLARLKRNAQIALKNS